MADEQAAGGDAAGPSGKALLKLLSLAAIVGLVVSFAAWCFLELVHVVQDFVFDDLPDALGFSHTPSWWAIPVLAIAGFAVAGAIVRLPGKGGHVPALGLNPSPSMPADIPGITLAAVAGIGFGIVLGPEAPLIGLGGALGYLGFQMFVKEGAPEVGQLISSSGIFAAVSFLFGSPLIAAVLLVEITGLDRKKMTMLLIPGLLAAGIGSLVAIGMGSWTGVNTSEISMQILPLPEFARPTFVDFLWTVPLAALLALGIHLILRLGNALVPAAAREPFRVVPAVGLIIGIIAFAFVEITNHGADEILFSGQSAVGPLVSDHASWTVGALLLLLVMKGLAYGLALGSWRGGPVFPALLLGAAAGIAASHLPGFDLTPAVAVGMGAAVVAVLRLPLSSVILAVLLSSQSGPGAGPLVIVGVLVALLVTMALPDPTEKNLKAAAEAEAEGPGPAAPAPTPA